MPETVIAAELSQNLGAILPRITRSHLERYDTLQNTLYTTNVSVDRSYQRMFVAEPEGLKGA